LARSPPIKKFITGLALLAAFAGCEQSQSRLDKVTGTDKVTSNDKVAEHATDPTGAAPPAGMKMDRSGSVEDQLKRLQDGYDRNAEALELLNKVYAQQQKQQQAQLRDEAADDAMFAVNVAEAIKAGQVDGPASAPVTVVKAFDFACPYCQQVSATMEELVKEYNGKGARGVREPGGPSARQAGAPRKLRGCQAGQVHGVQGRVLGEGLLAVFGLARA
jgi:protein-disulfide isomerase